MLSLIDYMLTVTGVKLAEIRKLKNVQQMPICSYKPKYLKLNRSPARGNYLIVRSQQ